MSTPGAAGSGCAPAAAPGRATGPAGIHRGKLLRADVSMTDVPFGQYPHTLEAVIEVAVARASMCWENPGEAGVFDDVRSSLIVDELVAWIGENYVPRSRLTTRTDVPDAGTTWADAQSKPATS